MDEQNYYLYIIECDDGSLYTGISTDPERRLKEHTCGKLGAKYTKAHKPVKIVYTEIFKNRSAASKREYEVKQLNHVQKLQLISR